MLNIIGHKNKFLIFSGLLVVISLAAVLVWGLKLGIDFTGGAALEVEFAERVPRAEDIRKTLESLHLGQIFVQPIGEKGTLLRFKEADELLHQEILQSLRNLSASQNLGAVSEKRFDAIGPTIGRELKKNSVLALILALLCIIAYIALAFRRVSKPVSSWKYGVAAILALTHDVAIPVGVFAFLGHYRGAEIDPLFITALLTVLGFSVHDTIVVFDRIRENLHKNKSSLSFQEVVNHSVNETIARSINTSLTVLLVLLAVFFWGGESIKYFSLTLILGVVFGTYSSIFIASPLLVIWHKFSLKKVHK